MVGVRAVQLVGPQVLTPTVRVCALHSLGHSLGGTLPCEGHRPGDTMVTRHKRLESVAQSACGETDSAAGQDFL